MSAPDLTRFDELVSRYLDASLGDADAHELLTHLSDEILAARFYEATQLDVEIAGVLAGSVPNEVMIRLVWSDLIQSDRTSVPGAVNARAKRRRIPQLLALAAMMVVLAGVTVYLVPHGPVPRTADAPQPAAATKTGDATVTSVHGDVYVIRSTGRVRLPSGQSLMDGGTIETMGPDSGATVTLRDGSEIELKGDTTFTAELGATGRRLILQQGMIVATVAKQPENTPLIFNTDRATATVRGTQLALVAEKSGTYLIVTEGSVTLQRSSGGPEVLIETGFYGHVELGGQFHPFPISRLPHRLQEQLPER